MICQLCCSTAKNFVLSEISLILLFLSSGRVLENCFKTKLTLSRVSQFCLRVDCSFDFYFRSVQKYQNYYVIKCYFLPQLGSSITITWEF